MTARFRNVARSLRGGPLTNGDRFGTADRVGVVRRFNVRRERGTAACGPRVFIAAHDTRAKHELGDGEILVRAPRSRAAARTTPSRGLLHGVEYSLTSSCERARRTSAPARSDRLTAPGWISWMEHGGACSASGRVSNFEQTLRCRPAIVS